MTFRYLALAALVAVPSAALAENWVSVAQPDPAVRIELDRQSIMREGMLLRFTYRGWLTTPRASDGADNFILMTRVDCQDRGRYYNVKGTLFAGTRLLQTIGIGQQIYPRPGSSEEALGKVVCASKL